MSQTITAGQVEALFRLKDEMSATLKNIADNTKETGAAFDGIAGAAFVFNNIRDAAGSVFGFLQGVVGGVAGAIGGMVSNVLELGGSMVDASVKTKISVETLQEYKYAAEQSGATLDQVTTAVGILQKGIVAGDKDITSLGLNLRSLREASPEEAFNTVATAIANIKNPTEQAAAAMAVFGKSGRELIPMLENDLAGTMERARELGFVMSTETALAADALGDTVDTLSLTWDGLKNNLVSVIVENASLHAFLEKGIEVLGRWSKAVSDNRSFLGDLVSNGVIIFAKALVGLVEVGIMANDWLTSMGELWRGTAVVVLSVAEAFIKATLAIGYAVGTSDEQMNEYDRHLNMVQAAIAGYGKASQDAVDSNTAMANRLIEVQSGLKEMAAAAEAAKGKALELTAGTREGTGAFVDQAEAIKARSEAAKEWAIAAAKYEKEATDAREKAAQAWAEAKEKYDEEALAAQQRHAEAVREVILQTQAEEIEAAKVAAQAVVDAWDSAADLFGDIFDTFEALGLESFASIAEAGMNTASMLAQAAEQGYISWAQLGQQVVGIVKNASVAGGALSGAMTGFAIGGPIGAGIGAVGGALLGLFGKANAAAEALKKMRAEFLQSVGGMDALRAKAETAGVSLEALFKAKSAEQLKRAIEQIKGSLDSWDEAQQKLNAAIEEYGFTVDELGPRMAAQRLEEQAGSLLEKYHLLTAAGVDHDAILARMGPDFGKYVDLAIASGQSIPESMRAIVDELFAQGKLLHENGEAYTEAEKNGITYAQTMSEQFAGLMEQIERLVRALTQGINVPINFQPNYPEGATGGNGGGPHHPPPDDYDVGGLASGPQSGHLERLHGDEYVLPRKQNYMRQLAAELRAAGAGGSSGGERPIVVESHLHVAERELAYSQSTADRRREGRRDRSAA